MAGIKLSKKKIKGQPGYDVKFTDSEVTVLDYLETINDFIENGELARLWPEERRHCQGCDLCCHEPLPVTSVDVLNICRATSTDITTVFRYLWVEVRGNYIDITLRRGPRESCVFLRENGTCSIYAYRPFTCQTYICCQTSAKAELLRSRIVNLGMDELIRSSILAFKAKGGHLPLNESREALVSASDWPENCFTGKNDYGQVRLRDVLTSDFKRFW
ncbi:MAG: YkgJ family cysteine cluster protein [Deltaproteobacteria bacterium]